MENWQIDNYKEMRRVRFVMATGALILLLMLGYKIMFEAHHLRALLFL